jgi:hypothetical protein
MNIAHRYYLFLQTGPYWSHFNHAKTLWQDILFRDEKGLPDPFDYELDGHRQQHQVLPLPYVNTPPVQMLRKLRAGRKCI